MQGEVKFFLRNTVLRCISANTFLRNEQKLILTVLHINFASYLYIGQLKKTLYES